GDDTRDFSEAELAGRLRVGFVFQGGHLFNELTIAENVVLPLRYRKNLTPAEAGREGQVFLDLLELTPLAHASPADVSTSWRQRAALARALVLKPEVLLLDNPLAGLVTRHRQWWLRFLGQLSRGHGTLGGEPLTVIVTADDLRPWQGARREFALLHEKKFTPLGDWNKVEAADHPGVREMLAVHLETAAA